MVRILQSSWLTALVGCLLYLGVTVALIRPGQFEAIQTTQTSGGRHARLDEPSWRFRNPEFDQWVQEIKHEKEALASKELQLRELQSRLESERQELNTATQTIYQLQREFDKNVIRIKDQEVDNLKRQAKVMSSMSPESAANLISQMPQEDAVRILYTMKADEASVILENLTKLGKNEARRAALVTEQLRHTLPAETAARPKPSS